MVVVMQVLMVYGAQDGATADTVATMARMFHDAGHTVRVVDAEQDQVDGVTGDDLVIVGSGIHRGKWATGPEQFLRRFQRDL